MKRMLITGSSGLIGTKLVDHFKNDYEIIEIDREKSKSIEFQNLMGFTEKIDVIIHLASNCMIRDIVKNPMIAFDNTWNTFNIFELARKSGCKKLVYFSSSRVSGGKHSPYTAGKVYGEELAKAYKDCYGIDYLIIRPETVWDIKEKKPRVMPLWIEKACNNEDIIVYGDENKILPPIHVNDFVELFVKLFNDFYIGNLKGECISISGAPLKVSEIISTIKKVTNSSSKVIYKNAERGQPQHYIHDKNQIMAMTPFERVLKRELNE